MPPKSDYMLIFRNAGPETHAHLNTEQRAQMAKQWNDWVGGLAQQKKLLHGRPLALSGRVVTGTRGVVTDGPYAEATEVIGGYVAFSAADINEATEIAKQCPGLSVGLTVEVRQLLDASPVLDEVKGRV